MAALIFPGAAGCKRAVTETKTPAVPVQTDVAVRADVPVTQQAIGTVQALRTVAVKSQVDGVIASFHFREGDEVKAGDPLVTLDRRPFENGLRASEADLANARAEQAQAEADVGRYRQLDQQNVISKEQLALLVTKADTARAVVQAKEAALANAKLQLEYSEIRAPIAGRTGQRNLHEGALVKAGDATQSIVVINQIAPIAVAYSVPEGVLAAVRAAQAAGPVEVMATVHAGDASRTVGGKLDFIDNAVDATTGMVVLKAVYDNATRALWPGQFTDVATRIGVDAGVVLVPAAAVQTGQRGSQVFVVKADKTVDLREVKTGRTVGGRTIILSGVEEGETVVVDGQLRLVPGARTEVRTLDSVAPAAGQGNAKKTTKT
ncbi:MAG: efflux RND transporter periplasmic adaptor subunit [Opitutaceae bacterium]|jgi:multidrug efflux system membrane fusion protein